MRAPLSGQLRPSSDPLILGDPPPGPPVVPTDVRCAECADVFATSATTIHHRGRGNVPVCCPCAHDAGEACEEAR